MALNPFQKAAYGMMRAMTRVMPSCQDTAALVSQGLDRRLPLAKRLGARLHLSMCSVCRRYEKQLRLLRRGAARYADPDANPAEPSLSAEAIERLKSAVERGEK